MTMPAVGDLAPDVALPDETGTIHRLADQRGRWTVLYFYPEDDTPGCTTEACEFRDRNDVIRERGADVFTLLADEGHPVADAYGAWGEKQNYGRTYMGLIRSTFLIDPEGRIARVWPKVKAKGHAEAVLAALDELQAARVS
jgi:peroxiredoxin Q/BCP